MHERTNIQLSRTDRSQLKAVVANRNSARVAPDVRKRQQDSVFPTLSQPIDPLLQEHGLAVARGGSDQGDRAGGNGSASAIRRSLWMVARRARMGSAGPPDEPY